MKENKSAVTYSVVAHKNPLLQSSVNRFYAQAQARGEMGFQTLCDRIQHSCTVTKPDIVAVLTALEDVMSEGLANGEIVRLGEFGTFQVSIKSAGAASRDEFGEQYIRGIRYLFRPGGTLKRVRSTLHFERVARRMKKL